MSFSFFPLSGYHLSLNKIIFYGLLMISLSSSLPAQSSILDAYIEVAFNENLQIRNAQLGKNKQFSKIAQAQALWNPKLDFNASYLLAQGGRNLIFPIGDLFNPSNAALNQLTNSDQFPTNLENQKIQLTPSNFIDANLNLSKPILNSTIKYNRLIQESLSELYTQDIALSKHEVKYQVKSAYYNYLKTFDGIKIIDSNRQLLVEVLELNKKLVKYDKATKDILNDVTYQIESLNTQQIQLEEQQSLAKALFNLQLNRDLQSNIIVDTSLIGAITMETRMLDGLTAKAYRQHPELAKILIGNKVNALNKQRIDKEKLPTVGVNAGIGMQTEDFSFDSGGPLYTLGVGMQWNIIDGGLRKRKIEELQVDNEILSIQESQIKQKIQISILQSLLALNSIESQMRSAELAATSAQESYDLIRTRYKNDSALLIEVLQAQNRLISSELSHTLLNYDYLAKQAELEKNLANSSTND
jgi:outer membrane protein